MASEKGTLDDVPKPSYKSFDSSTTLALFSLERISMPDSFVNLTQTTDLLPDDASQKATPNNHKSKVWRHWDPVLANSQ